MRLIVALAIATLIVIIPARIGNGSAGVSEATHGLNVGRTADNPGRVLFTTANLSQDALSRTVSFVSYWSPEA